MLNLPQQFKKHHKCKHQHINNNSLNQETDICYSNNKKSLVKCIPSSFGQTGMPGISQTPNIENYNNPLNINSLTFSNTQGQINFPGVNLILNNLPSLTQQQITKIQQIIPQNLSNNHPNTLKEIKELIEKQKLRSTQNYNDILIEREHPGMVTTFEKHLRNKLDNDLLNIQINRVKKYINHMISHTHVYITKQYFNRVRPSILADNLLKHKIIDNKLTPFIEIPNHPAYPSGHATYSRLASIMLTHYDPDNKDLYFEIGNTMATNREIAGLHYKSDTEAGYILAEYLANLFINNNI